MRVEVLWSDNQAQWCFGMVTRIPRVPAKIFSQAQTGTAWNGAFACRFTSGAPPQHLATVTWKTSPTPSLLLKYLAPPLPATPRGSCERLHLLYREGQQYGFTCVESCFAGKRWLLVQTKLGTLFSVTAAPPSHSNTSTKRSEVS